MIKIQQEQIVELRKKGYGYILIGQMLGFNGDTVCYFCKSNGIAVVGQMESHRLRVKGTERRSVRGNAPVNGGKYLNAGKESESSTYQKNNF